VVKTVDQAFRKRSGDVSFGRNTLTSLLRLGGKRPCQGRGFLRAAGHRVRRGSVRGGEGFQGRGFSSFSRIETKPVERGGFFADPRDCPGPWAAGGRFVAPVPLGRSVFGRIMKRTSAAGFFGPRRRSSAEDSLRWRQHILGLGRRHEFSSAVSVFGRRSHFDETSFLQVPGGGFRSELDGDFFS